MKVTYNWLKDFVDIDIPPRELAQKLTMAGLEVGGCEERDGDCVFEIEITSNRPDWLSVTGLAREVAAVTNKKMRDPFAQRSGAGNKNIKTGVAIEIADKKDCPLYTARIVRDVAVGASPDWMKQRLELVGCRSINNVVDITNYILFESGEPLHAFDLDRLASPHIIVRRAYKNETLTTIDGKKRELTPDILVIADKEKAVAVAGIMGGIESEVGDSTRSVLLEAAVFDPVLIRRGRQILGIQTEAAYRFERGISPGIVSPASFRAAQLLEEIAGGQMSAVCSSRFSAVKSLIVSVRLSVVERILGVSVPFSAAQKMLVHLGFTVTRSSKDMMRVTVPPYRTDVKIEEDIIEEIARIYGYEKIKVTLPSLRPKPAGFEKRDAVLNLKRVLVGLGLHEVNTLSLTDKKTVTQVLGAVPASAIEIMNPLSGEQEMMSPSSIPGLLRCVSRNLNHKQEYINIFEITKNFSWVNNVPLESGVLGIALCGVSSRFTEHGVLRENATLLHLKGICEAVFGSFGISAYSFAEQAGEIRISIKGKDAGFLRIIPSPVLDAFDIKNRQVFCSEINLDILLDEVLIWEKKFVSLPLYPSISRDISMVVGDTIPAGRILSAVHENGSGLLTDVKISDYYKGKQIPAGFKGLTITCIYRSSERTLTDAEVVPLHSRICALLTDTFKATLR
ncbi:MAG: phenylalanine--tRNA ligase subunit beta [Candidatus Omnitrophica bacterium]|nr:phenylalanine--tRNA ligase subunit beta [Candidatus Omnitrophota bacterium]